MCCPVYTVDNQIVKQLFIWQNEADGKSYHMWWGITHEHDPHRMPNSPPQQDPLYAVTSQTTPKSCCAPRAASVYVGRGEARGYNLSRRPTHTFLSDIQQLTGRRGMPAVASWVLQLSPPHPLTTPQGSGDEGFIYTTNLPCRVWDFKQVPSSSVDSPDKRYISFLSPTLAYLLPLRWCIRCGHTGTPTYYSTPRYTTPHAARRYTPN